MELGSTSINDRCGVCNGDGTSCGTTVDLSNNSVSQSNMIVNKNLMQRMVILQDRKFTKSYYNILSLIVDFSRAVKLVPLRQNTVYPKFFWYKFSIKRTMEKFVPVFRSFFVQFLISL